MGRILALALALCVSSMAMADALPAAQLGRLAAISGVVTYHAGADATDSDASVNYPLTTGNRIATAPRAHAILDIAAGRFHIDGASAVTIGALGLGMTVLRLEQGAVILHILPGGAGQVFVIETPAGALRADQPGYFEVEVSGQSGTVVASALEGGAQFEATVLAPGTRATLAKSSAPVLDAAVEDDFIRRIAAEVAETGENKFEAPNHVSPQVTGFQELQSYGLWIASEQYGWVWEPQVMSDWAPLHDGRWVEVAGLGRTWIDAAPWGFAPSHYGRWTKVNERWVWIPDASGATSGYAPAVASFFGNEDPSGQSAGGWVPLGPEEPVAAAAPVIVNNVRVINRPVVPKVVTVNNINNTTNVTTVVQPDRQPAVVLTPRSFPNPPPPSPPPSVVSSPPNLTGLGASGTPMQSGVGFPGN